MSLEVKVPAVGESITEVTIASWHKKDGDHVNAEEILCELESDKATFELPAETSGILRIKAQEGETIEIGGLVCIIEENGSSNGAGSQGEKQASAPASSAPAPSGGSGKVLEMTVPAVGESISEVTIGTWNRQDGDFVKKEEVLCEIESDKATFELPAEGNGILRIVAQTGDVLEIGALICKIELSDAAPAQGSQAQTPSSGSQRAESSASRSNESYATGHPSPAASKIMAEKGLNSDQVKGTGVDGRITKEDAMKAEKPAASAPKPAAQSSAPSAPAQPASTGGSRDQKRQKMSSLRKTVARRLVQVKNETAMLTTFNEVDMKPIMELRSKYKDKFKEKHEIGLGFMSFFTKAVCVALQEFPSVNAQIDGDEMVFNDFCDVSIAVSAPKGLVVPVIRNAEKLDFAGIEKEVMRLALRARDNKLSIDEMTGGTFTITNGGIFGSMMSTPIINAPQSAILGMHNIVERPVAINGQVVIRPMMYVALSYDHRIIDGRESVGFLVRVKQLLEDPTRLLLGV